MGDHLKKGKDKKAKSKLFYNSAKSNLHKSSNGRQSWGNGIAKVLRENNCQSTIKTLAWLPFNNESLPKETKAEFATNRPTLKKVLKDLYPKKGKLFQK